MLGAVVGQRDAFVTALNRHMADAGAMHGVTKQTGGDLTLLLGLNRSDASEGNAANLADQSLRSQLNDAHQPYQVLYGELDEQLAQAVRILHFHQRNDPSDSAQNISDHPRTSIWRWACDKCSDPVCEHKLLTDLLAQRVPQA